MARWVAFDSHDVCAVIEDAPGGGSATDANADRNRPVVDPASWIDKVKFHSDFDYYELEAAVQTTTVTHPVVAAYSDVVPNTWPNLTEYGGFKTTDSVLIAHNLGYVPKYMVAYNGARLPNGYRIQTVGHNGRYVQHWADTTRVYVRDFGYSSSSDLPALSATYQVMVFKTPQAESGARLLDYVNSSGVLKLGHGKVRSDKHYLRAVLPSESSFDLNYNGPTMDLNNGGIRVVTGGTVIDENGYGGGFAGPDFVPIGGIF